MLNCGIDEAGRGCILGPLVLCGVSATEEQEQRLRNIGVKDSKMLTPVQRERLYDQILGIVTGHVCVSIPPEEIDLAVLSDFTNLNWLEADKAADVINGLKPDQAIIDCPSPNIKAYTDYLVQRVKLKPRIICAHHADAEHVIVGAASIIAKVTRDRAIEQIKLSIGHDFGSGYLTDPKTQSFLRAHWDTHHELFRKSWAPYRDVSGLKAQKKLGEF